MGRFYFHLYAQQQLHQDPEGSEFEDLEAAKAEAATAARELLYLGEKSGASALDQAYYIADDSGEIRFILRFSDLDLSGGQVSA